MTKKQREREALNSTDKNNEQKLKPEEERAISSFQFSLLPFLIFEIKSKIKKRVRVVLEAGDEDGLFIEIGRAHV